MKFNRLIILLTLVLLAIPVIKLEAEKLPGFKTSPYYDEQVTTFNFIPDIRIHINAPSDGLLDENKPVGLALFALPNGNTIEQTVGKVLDAGDDWHYDIQHIGAQTRFLRQKIADYNLVTVYLEAKQKSWPAWKSQNPDYADIIKALVEYLKSYFRDYRPFVILTGHSGGGRFIFSFLDAFPEIPDYVDRICFLDSNYGYEHTYGDQMMQWLNASSDHYLSVLAYNDSVALYNGAPIVSPTGGTWYRSRIMQKYFANYYTFNTSENDEFIRHEALGGRMKILLKKNPEQKILHTVQVERNGFIHTMLTGTLPESDGYEYYGERIYSDLVQADEPAKSNFQIPLRSPDAMNGTQFMQSVINMSFSDRENAILHELLTGNIPYFLRDRKEFETSFDDAHGIAHKVKYRVMPDYLAIGADSNYYRIPMGPLTAQRAADFFGACMPTRKLVDQIYQNSEIKLAPVTYVPVGDENSTVQKFVEHNDAIESQLITAGAARGQLIGGTKKDVVLSNKITDPARPNHVVIYGWHQLNGSAIQPLTNIHVDTYVDYSHGIRLLDAEIDVDGVVQTIPNILKDPVLYKVLSDESGAMAQPTYIVDSDLPGKPASFGVITEEESQIKIIISPDANVDRYQLYISSDGINFSEPVTFSSNEYILKNLSVDSVVYVKLRAENTAGYSVESGVLAALPQSTGLAKILIVNGFDRTSAGNTFDFIRRHAAAIVFNGAPFESATNDAITDGLISLQDYLVVNYILGDESTVDESFSSAEQSLVSVFLKSGGRLLVSGAEIAWDLDYKGSPGDKAFFYDYLKAKYSADAPGGISGTYYAAKGSVGGIFEGIADITFDNGSQGTINVKYADALIPMNGSKGIINYKDVTTHSIGAVSFEGVFKDGNKPGKLIYMGFPFETIYPAGTRKIMMEKILTFLISDVSTLAENESNFPTTFNLAQNYPNPFNPQTTIEFSLPGSELVTLTVFDVRGRIVDQMIKQIRYNAGNHNITWSGEKYSTGSYFYRLDAGEYSEIRKMILIR